jgi:hypothetical protein
MSDPVLLKQAVNAVAAAGGNQVHAARGLKIARGTLQARLRAADLAGIVADPGASPPADEATLSARERIAMQDTIRDLRAQIANDHREAITDDNVRQAIIGLAAQSPTPPRWMIEPRSHKRAVTGTPCVLWSDWHWGEVVDPTQINGVNEFNMAIARDRLRTLVERTVDLCFSHMTNPVYPGIVVCLGGDMISGDIHEELTETNELPVMPAWLDLLGHLEWALRTLADKFGRVRVIGQHGNHGRTTKKPRMKGRAYTNYDWLLYQVLEKHFVANKDDRVSFFTPANVDAPFNIYGHRYLLTHGDNLGVKGGDGIIGALGPILRGDVKIRNSNGHMGQPFDTLLMGHWHQLLPLWPRVCVNGSLKGYDEFAKLALRAAPEEPQQALWFTHPERGITCSWPVKLGAKRAEAGRQAWVAWPDLKAAA